MNNQLTIFDRQFQKLHARSWEIIEKTPNEKLFWQPNKIDVSFPVNSCGEYILRSAGTVEQTFNGITAKLWDDPFEWTLPEALSTSRLILDYLAEVEGTRRRGFAFFHSPHIIGNARCKEKAFLFDLLCCCRHCFYGKF
jgi:hypothetical protein